MKCQFLFSVLAVCCNFYTADAQGGGNITGKVKTAGDKYIPSATAALFHYPDSILVKTTISGRAGNFEFSEIKSSNYYIIISHAGYTEMCSEIFSVNPGLTTEVKPFVLSIAQKNLSGITVAGKKPLVEVTGDKTIFNVESSINAAGSNAFELLQKSPGVITDKDDAVILKGRSGVRVYIDGRLVQMDAADLAAYLKSINSADIEAIEIIANPSAKYDASGNAGIINIRFKKNRKLGYNGSVNAGFAVGVNPKTNAGINFNYRNKAINIFSNYSNAWTKNQVNFNVYRKQNDSLYDQKNINISEGWSHNVKAGADFFITKAHTIGAIVTANFSDNTSENRGRTPISSVSNGKLGQVLYANNTLPAAIKNLNYNFNYRFADSSGNEFNLDADVGKYTSDRSSYQPNYYYAPSPEVLQDSHVYKNNTPTDVKILTFKMDYVRSLKNSTLYAGVKSGNVRTDNIFQFYNVLNGFAQSDLVRSNSFMYKENVFAAYASYSTLINTKWKMQAGLRMEHTSSNGHLTRANNIVLPDDLVERKYTDFFPSVGLTYNVSHHHSLNLALSRRIDRPVYQDLNPFENKLDELTYQKGNAFLQPQYANNIQLMHTYKGKYITALSYAHVSGFTAQIIDTLEGKRTFITKRNLASQDIVSLNFSLPIQLKSWWLLFTNANLFYSHYKADLGPGKLVDINITSGSVFAQNSFTLGDGYSAEITGNFNAPSVWAGTFRSNAMGSLDAGVQKLLFQKKATVKLGFTDILKTLRWKGKSEFSGSNIVTTGNWESRQVRLNFTYRFGNNQVKQARQRDTGSDEEKKRTEANGSLGQ